MLEDATLSGPMLLAALLVTFVGGLLIAYGLTRKSARELYRLLKIASREEAPDGDDGRGPRVR